METNDEEIVVEEIKHKEKKFWLSGNLKFMLNWLKEGVSKNWDGLIVIDGVEGGGKSTLARQIAFYLNPDFTLDNIVFTTKQFDEAVDKSKPEDVIIWDEFTLGGSLSTEAMSQIQNSLIRKLTTIRKKRLYIVLLVSWIFMLRSYFAVMRSRFLIHIYTPDGIKRGFFKLYGWEDKRKLYVYGKRDLNYNVVQLQKLNYGVYSDYDKFIDLDEYETKKDEAIKELLAGGDDVDARACCPFCKAKNIVFNQTGNGFCRRCGEKFTRNQLFSDKSDV